jgi:hypothetical protein
MEIFLQNCNESNKNQVATKRSQIAWANPDRDNAALNGLCRRGLVRRSLTIQTNESPRSNEPTFVIARSARRPPGAWAWSEPARTFKIPRRPVKRTSADKLRTSETRKSLHRTSRTSLWKVCAHDVRRYGFSERTRNREAWRRWRDSSAGRIFGRIGPPVGRIESAKRSTVRATAAADR